MKETYVSAFAKTKDADGKETQKNYAQRAAHIKSAFAKRGDTSPQTDAQGKAKGLTLDLAKDGAALARELRELRKSSATENPVDLSIGELAAMRYGIKTDEKGTGRNYFKALGLDLGSATFSEIREGKLGSMSFNTMADFDRGFEWLVDEVVTDILRTGLMSRGLYREITGSFETISRDNLTIPIVQNASYQMRAIMDGANAQAGDFGFQEIQMQTKELASTVKLSDRTLRSVKIDLLREYFMSISDKLQIQLSADAVNRILNGNTAAANDAAPIVGVGTTGSFDYDNDWLELVLGGSELGYSYTTVLGARNMVKQAMALEEFKGFDGVATKAQTVVDTMAAPLPAQYRFMTTGHMPSAAPAGGQLLFLDVANCLTHYTSKPLQLEQYRIYDQLTTGVVASMTSLFVKKRADSAMILDSSVSNTTNPFPEEYDMEAYERQVGGTDFGF